MRSLATEYEVDVYRFSGARRRFSQDLSHPDIIYEPGKCISCDACVRIAAAASERLGLAVSFDARLPAAAVSYCKQDSSFIRRVGTLRA